VTRYRDKAAQFDWILAPRLALLWDGLRSLCVNQDLSVVSKSGAPNCCVPVRTLGWVAGSKQGVPSIVPDVLDLNLNPKPLTLNPRP